MWATFLSPYDLDLISNLSTSLFIGWPVHLPVHRVREVISWLAVNCESEALKKKNNKKKQNKEALENVEII